MHGVMIRNLRQDEHLIPAEPMEVPAQEPELDLVLLGQSNRLAGQPNAAAMMSSAGQGASSVSVEQNQVGGYAGAAYAIWRKRGRLKW